MEYQQTAGQGRRLDFNPVSRVGGALAFHTVVDLENQRVLEAASEATVFRGYENVLQGRDVRDAIFLSSRSCGVCGGVHSTAASLAVEMALGVRPPGAGIVARNMLVALEFLYDHSTQMFMRAGPDFSEPVMRETNPDLWERAQQAPARGRAVHQYERISDIMTAMTAMTGELHAEALDYSRQAREAYSLIGGKYPHPQTITPGGISSRIDRQYMNLMWLRVVPFIDYAKKVVAIWDDLTDFLLEADPRYAEVGAGRLNFIDLGLWDDPDAYDGTYESASRWGERRWATPGAIVDGRLVTTDILQVSRGVEEFVDHSFYDQWSGGGQTLPTDPAGNQLSINHPWNKQTIPRPAGVNLGGKYSWATAPRWDRQPMETGAYSRLWVTAMANKLPHRRFIEPTGRSLRMSMPQGSLPASVLEWHIPQTWGTLERNRARAYALAYSAAVAHDNVLVAFDLMRRGGPEARVFTPYRIPKDFRVGAGLWGGARGYLSHHMTIDGGVIQNYQIIGSSAFSTSPMDGTGTRGPMEQAVVSTPLLSSARPEIDVLRTIRSFDPCMACSAH